MPGTTPRWVKVLALLSLVCGLVGIFAGAWLFAPILILGLLLLVIPMRHTPPPS